MKYVFLFIFCISGRRNTSPLIMETQAAGNVHTLTGENLGYGAVPSCSSTNNVRPASSSNKLRPAEGSRSNPSQVMGGGQAEGGLPDDDVMTESYIAGRSPRGSSAPTLGTSDNDDGEGSASEECVTSDINKSSESEEEYSDDENEDEHVSEELTRQNSALKSELTKCNELLKKREEELNILRGRETHLNSELKVAFDRETALKEELKEVRIAKERQEADYIMLQSTFHQVKHELQLEKEKNVGNVMMLPGNSDCQQIADSAQMAEIVCQFASHADIPPPQHDITTASSEHENRTYTDMETMDQNHGLSTAFSEDRFNVRRDGAAASTPLLTVHGNGSFRRNFDDEARPFIYDEATLPADNEAIYNVLRTQRE